MDGLDLRPATHTSQAQTDDEDRIRLSWPREQLAQALEALASRTGLRAAAAGRDRHARYPAARRASVYAGNWIEWAAGCWGSRRSPWLPVPDLVQGLLQA